jgi:hypothetical protein
MLQFDDRIVKIRLKVNWNEQNQSLTRIERCILQSATGVFSKRKARD